REQLGCLGNTPYRLDELELEMDGQPFAPSSLLNQLRRRAIEQLSTLQTQPRAITINDPQATLEQALRIRSTTPTTTSEPSLHILVRTPEQLEAAIALRPASITLDYLELYG